MALTVGHRFVDCILFRHCFFSFAFFLPVTQGVVVTKPTFGELMVTESMPAPRASIEVLKP